MREFQAHCSISHRDTGIHCDQLKQSAFFMLVQDRVNCFLKESCLQLNHLSGVPSGLFQKIKSVYFSVATFQMHLFSQSIAQFLEFTHALRMPWNYNHYHWLSTLRLIFNIIFTHCNRTIAPHLVKTVLFLSFDFFR